MSKKIAVILSGSGVYDGSEIHEVVLTLLRLDQLGVTVQCFAPDIKQHHVINHLTGEEMSETRNVLLESARIARGNCKAVTELTAAEFDAVILPGGFGAAKNLSDFAFNGANCTVEPATLAAVQSFVAAGKPVGLMCIAPALAAKFFGQGVLCTIGTDTATAEALEQMGAQHQTCTVDALVIDEKNNLVTTPAYMLAENISQAAEGIFSLVEEIVKRV